MRKKVLTLGIDGATFDLILPWVEKGELPTLEKLIEEGSWSELQSTPLPLTAPAWVSFMTGKNPGKHGIYDFVRVTKDYKTVPISSRDIDSETILEIASYKGKRVISINVPITYPPFKINGYMISGMPASNLSDGITYPEEISKRIPEDYKMIPVEVYEGNNEEEILKELEHMLDVQLEVIKDFIKEKWDLFIVVFFATDVVSHWFWKYYDENHPLHREKYKRHKDAILRIYKRVDNCIGEILSLVDSDIYVLLMSDHGFGPLHRDIFINNWLVKKGYLKFKKNIITRIKLLAYKLGWTLENLYAISEKLKIAKLTVTMSEEKRQSLLKLLLSFSDVDWKRTKAYSMTNFGPIFINLKGREARGIVERGEEYRKLIEEIKEGLLEIIDDDGEKAIEKVYTKEELFSGKYLDYAPDIIYIPKGMKYTANRYFEFGSNKLFGKPHRDMSGDHRYNGIFVAKGPGIKRGFRFSDAVIWDIAPTILYLLGVGIPEDMDGRVLKEIFSKDVAPITKEEEMSMKKEQKRQLTAKEERKIKERLRGLGYVG
jgi:predicted AlkP superfamily phosphohydrolase/phosphomutase